MNAALTSLVSRVVGLCRMGGPIFEKELRVSSRRGRNYFLRFAYVTAMTIFVTFAWMATVSSRGSASPAFRISRMGEAGKSIVTTIVWFQFITGQIIAAVMLSTAISDEIHRRTLGLLMTTPIGSFQIVIGKLLSKLLQLILLLAISLPLLAVVRVFGGVPWDYVVSSLCVTLTAAVFAGSVSLFFSISTKKAHEVVVKTFVICFFLYLVIPGAFHLLMLTARFRGPSSAPLAYINPFIVMAFSTTGLMYPSAGGSNVFWPAHCAVMLGVSTVCLALSMVSVRTVALRQATGEAGLFTRRKERRLAGKKAAAQLAAESTTVAIRPVVGPPLIWKDIRTALLGSHPVRRILGYVFAGVCLVFTYGFCIFTHTLGQKEVQAGFVLAYLFLGLLRTAAVSAGAVTSEKEAQTWPILLTTPLDRRNIVAQKIAGSALRAWPFWLLFVVHLLVFGIIRFIHPVAVPLLILLAAASALLVSCAGVCFSSFCRRTSTASVLNLTCFFLFTVPFCCPLPVFIVSPFFVAAMILTVGSGNFDASMPFYELQYGFFPGLKGFLVSLLMFVGMMAVYLLIAFLFFSTAASNIRRNVF